MIAKIVRNKHCPLSNLSNSYPILTKLGESVYGHKISDEFDNQLDCPRGSPLFIKIFFFVMYAKWNVAARQGYACPLDTFLVLADLYSVWEELVQLCVIICFM